MYATLKVIHLLAVFSWMAGMFYLPRLFVYHSDVAPGSESDETFKVMERRLIKAIMRPAALVALLSGLGLIHVLVLWPVPAWLWLKLAAVVGMFVVHGMLEGFQNQFAIGKRSKSGRYFRILNEVPTLLLVVIVVAVVVRPF
ncbi:MAG: CopD family protein [Hyphomicrobiales bacterium]